MVVKFEYHVGIKKSWPFLLYGFENVFEDLVNAVKWLQIKIIYKTKTIEEQNLYINYNKSEICTY